MDEMSVMGIGWLVFYGDGSTTYEATKELLLRNTCESVQASYSQMPNCGQIPGKYYLPFSMHCFL